MENPLKNILLATAGAATLTGSSPLEEQGIPTPTEEVATEIIELPVEMTGEELEAEAEKERVRLETNNGQYTEEKAKEILSGTTRELE